MVGFRHGGNLPESHDDADDDEDEDDSDDKEGPDKEGGRPLCVSLLPVSCCCTA